MFNYHANLLLKEHQQIRENFLTIKPTKTGISEKNNEEWFSSDNVELANQYVQPKNEPLQMEETSNEIKSFIPSDKGEEKIHTYGIESTKIFHEAADLLTPFYMALDAVKDESLFRSMDDKNVKDNKNTKDIALFTSQKNNLGISVNKAIKQTDSVSYNSKVFHQKDETQWFRGTSVIQLSKTVPEIVFTTEELMSIKDQENIQKSNLRNTARRDLFEARVKNYFGQLSVEGMMMIVAAGRKAQNYYHYLTMSSLPFFQELSERFSVLIFYNFIHVFYLLELSVS